MYNTDLPRRVDLPSSAQLKRSTWVAAVAASGILAFIVLPSEYAIDPIGVGRVLGLTQMGQIKMQLAEETAQDAAATSAAQPAAGSAPTTDPAFAARFDRIEAMLQDLGARLPAVAQPAPAAVEQPAPVEAPAAEAVAEQAAEDRFAAAPPAEPQQQPTEAAWQDELSFTLAPGQGTEIKLVMEEGARADFYWTANGAVVNYDTHGDGGGNSISYEKGREVSEQEGVLEAAFTGNHGWFWRNRSGADVTVTLRTRGAYSDIKRMM